MPENDSYELLQGVQIVDDGDHTTRIRRGIWNFTEMTVDVSDEPEIVRDAVDDLLSELAEGRAVSPTAVAGRSARPSEVEEHLVGLCESMDTGGFAMAADEKTPAFETTLALLGEKAEGVYAGDRRGSALFFSDSDYATRAVEAIAEPLPMDVDVMSDDLYERIRRAGLTEESDAMAAAETRNELLEELSGYDCLLGCLASPNVVFLRNLNRLLLELEVPLSIGLVDGPFLSAFTVDPPSTGCVECYEQRILARMEDHHGYRSFVEGQRESHPGGVQHADESSPVLHWLVSIVTSEAFLLSAGPGMSKFTGRALNIYLPLFEVQAQDVLRLPSCEACRFQSKDKLDELYTSTANIINDMLEEIEVVEGAE